MWCSILLHPFAGRVGGALPDRRAKLRADGRRQPTGPVGKAHGGLSLASVLFLAAYAVLVLGHTLPVVWRHACVAAMLAAWALFGVDYAVRWGLSGQRLDFRPRTRWTPWPSCSAAASAAHRQGLRGRTASSSRVRLLLHVVSTRGCRPRCSLAAVLACPAGARGAGAWMGSRGLGVVDLHHAHDGRVRGRGAGDPDGAHDRVGADGVRSGAARRGDRLVLVLAAPGVRARGREGREQG